MGGKIIGYVRVSTIDQNPERQLEGVLCDKVYTDYASGKDVLRPELMKAVDYLREDDTLVVHSLDRLARNLEDLRNIVGALNRKGVVVKFLKENLIFDSSENAISKLMLSIIGAVAEFERSLIRERQLEGIRIAKQNAKYRGRQPINLEQNKEHILEAIKIGVSKAKIAKSIGISRQTLYSYLAKIS